MPLSDYCHALYFTFNWGWVESTNLGPEDPNLQNRPGPKFPPDVPVITNLQPLIQTLLFDDDTERIITMLLM